MDNTLNNLKDKGEKRGFFSIAQLYDSYFSQKTILMGKAFTCRIFFIFKKYFSITGPNVPEAVSFSCYV